MVATWATAAMCLLGCAGEETTAARPLLPGDTLEVTLTTYAGNGVKNLPPCWTAYVIDPDCGACNRLAADLGADANALRRTYWLFVGRERRMRDFVKDYEIDRSRVLRVDVDGEAYEVLDHLRIRGTPTQLVLDRESEIRHMTLSVRLLPDEEIGEYCGS